MSGEVINFRPKGPYHDERGFLRTPDGVLAVEPATIERKIYVLFSTPNRLRARKRWLVWIFFGDGSTEEIEMNTKDNWAHAMWRARLFERKYGFPIVDVGAPK